jgi:hypothetical protein
MPRILNTSSQAAPGHAQIAVAVITGAMLPVVLDDHISVHRPTPGHV